LSAAGGGDGANGGDRVDPFELSNWIPQLVERIGSDADPSASNVAPESLATLATIERRGRRRCGPESARRSGRWSAM
jgi:hypothetical protein